MQPALPAVGRQDQPVRAVLLEQLDLVALVEIADLGPLQLVWGVEQPDDPITDQSPLVTVQRTDRCRIEGKARR